MTTLTDQERMERAKGIRRYAAKLLAYYVALAPVIIPLGLICWIGEKAETLGEWLYLPTYRMRNAQEELRRELIRDNRRRARERGEEIP